MNAWLRSAIAAAALAGLVALPLFNLVRDDRIFWLVPIGFPGMFLSMAISNNVYAFNPSLAVAFTFAFYTLLFMLIVNVMRRFRG